MTHLVANISNSTNSPSAQFQVDFIVYLQRLLIEGGFSATYKFSLLHALADLCISNELDAYFTCDAQRSEFVATWAYNLAHQNGVSLWLSKNQFVPSV